MSDPDRDFDLEADSWDAHPARLRVAAAVAAAIRPALSAIDRPCHVLDYGCGTGLVALALADRCHHLTAVDRSAEMLRQLSRKLDAAPHLDHVRPLHADLEKGANLEGPFDAVVCTQTLNHVRDSAALLRSFARLLSPSGRLFLAEMDLRSTAIPPRPFPPTGLERDTLAAHATAAGLHVTAITDLLALDGTLPDGSPCQRRYYLLAARKPAPGPA